MDELYNSAVDLVSAAPEKVSTSYVQRRLSIGYNRACAMLEQMEADGVVSAADGAGKRRLIASADIAVTISAGGESFETSAEAVEQLAVHRDQSDLAATVDRARVLFDEGDYQAALMLSSGAYDKAKASAGFASRFKAGEQLIGKARRMQADALFIESRAKMAMADQVDEAQSSGMIAGKGRPKNILDGNIFTLEDAGFTAKQLHEARQLRDAEAKEPGIVQRAIEARVEAGMEASRAALKKAASHAIGTKSATTEEKGDQLYETPIEATRTVLALESFSAVIKEPFVGKGAILRPLEAAGYDVQIADLVDRGIATQHGEVQQVGDFLLSEPGDTVGTDIFTNPPYDDLANKCLAHALRVHKPRKMAALLNLNFMCGFKDRDRRYVMDDNPPSRVYVFIHRLPMMHRDGWDGNEASSQMNTGFFIWERNDDGSYGSGDGSFRVIRVNWSDYLSAEPLPPGAGGYRAPMAFAEKDDEFARSTPKREISERVPEEMARALVWMAEQDQFTLATLRKGIAVRELLAIAIIDECIAKGLIEGDGDYRVTEAGITALKATLSVMIGDAVLLDEVAA